MALWTKADFSSSSWTGTSGSGVLQWASNYDNAVYDHWDGTNEAAQIAIIESTYTFESMGLFVNFTPSITNGDERIINTDVCDVWELLRTQEKITAVSVDLQNFFNVDLIAKAFGLSKQTIPWTLVTGASQVTVSWAYAYNQFIKIANQNGDWSAVSITSVTGAIDWLLVSETDYFVWPNGVWETGITIIDSTTVTTMAQAFTIVYNYTPADTKILSMKRKQLVVPGQLLKFTSCPDADWKVDILYFVNAKLNSDYEMPMTNLLDNDFTPASITFEVARGWNFLMSKKKLTG